MAEMFHLGFEIDTRPLTQASTEANKAADAVTKLGTAEQKLAQDSQRAADGLKKTADEAGKTAKSMNDAANAKENAAKSTKDYEAQLGKLTGTLKMNQQDIMSLAGALRGSNGLVGGLEAAGGAVSRMAGALGPLGITLVGLPIALGIAGMAAKKMAEPFAEAQDAVGLLEARLRSALGSSSAAKATFDSLYESTQKTGLGFRETADSFLRLARNADSLGASRAQIQQLTDTVQKLGAVSGASKGEIGSGMLQLSQALASGRLNGDELRSIMENMPALAKAIADGLGVSVGQIRSMGAAGELTGDKVFGAILKSSAKANEEFAKLPDTVERANQRAADSFEQLMGTLGTKWNASGFVRGVTDLFTGLINSANTSLKPDSVGAQLAGLQAQRDKYSKLPGLDAQRQVSSIDSRIKALQDKGSKDMAEASKANADEEYNLGFSFVKKATELGSNEYDDYFKKFKKATDEAQKLQDAVRGLETRLETGAARPEERDLLKALRRQAGIASAEVDGLAAGLDKLKKDVGDSRLAALLGGGGGGTGIVANAIAQQRAAREKGLGGSLQDFMSGGVEQALIKGNEQITNLDRQTDAQRKLASAVGLSRSETIELEVANDTLAKKFELVGKLGGDGAEAWAKRYAAALRQSKVAADDLANSQARLALNDQIALAGAQLGAVGNPYEQRDLANQSQASITGRRDPVQAALMRQLFGIQEATSGANIIDGSSRNTAFNTAALGMSPAALREAELNRRIADAQRNVAPGQRAGVGAAIRAEDESQRTLDYDKQTQALTRQMKLLEDRAKLTGLAPEEYRVQNSLLTKRNELEAAGAPQAVIDRQLAITEQMERQAIAQDKIKSRYDGIVNTSTRLADGVGDAFMKSLEKGLAEGGKAGIHQLEFSFRTAIRRMGAEMTYEIAVRPFVEALKNMASTFGAKLAGMLFGGGGTANPSGATGADMSLFFSANGSAYGQGGVRAFANGGAFTNGIYSSPTLFKFANGGALGMMGEAGPEAVMPLTRGANGKLGVQASGGGGDVQVVINDMRSNPSGESIKVAESRGPDNRRILQVMVRDEVRRAVRSGELDTEMQNNFGVSRSVARR